MSKALLALFVASLHALDSARKTGVVVHSNGKLTTDGGSPEPLVTCTAARPQGIWPSISNALTGVRAKEISKFRFPVFPNFLGLVLGCIEAKFCK